MDISRLIINKPARRSTSQKVTGWMLTTLAWTIWTYLWAPLIGILGWYLGISLFENVMDDQGLRAFLNVLPQYIDYIAISSGTLIIWALMNWIRFKGHRDKRANGEHKVVSVESIAKYSEVESSSVAKWHKTKRLVAHYFSNGKLSHMVIDPNARYTGYSAIAVGDYSRRYAEELSPVVSSLSSNVHAKKMDLDLTLTLSEELSLVDRKLGKLSKMKESYLADLNLLANQNKPYKTVLLFAAQKRRLAAIELAISRYSNQRQKLVELHRNKRVVVESKRLESKNAIFIDDGTVIVDGTQEVLPDIQYVNDLQEIVSFKSQPSHRSYT